MTLSSNSDSQWVCWVAFSPSGDILVTATGNGHPGTSDSDGVIQFWDTSSYANIATLAHANVTRYGGSPEGRRWRPSASTGRSRCGISRPAPPRATLTGDSSGVTCIAFGPGNLLAGGFDDGTITLWDTASGRSITALSTGSDSALNCVAISPDGKTIASGGTNLTIWTVE